MITPKFLKLIENPKAVARSYRRFLMSVAESHKTPDEQILVMDNSFTYRQSREFASIIHEELKPEWN